MVDRLLAARPDVYMQPEQVLQLASLLGASGLEQQVAVRVKLAEAAQRAGEGRAGATAVHWARAGPGPRCTALHCTSWWHGLG